MPAGQLLIKTRISKNQVINIDIGFWYKNCPVGTQSQVPEQHNIERGRGEKTSGGVFALPQCYHKIDLLDLHKQLAQTVGTDMWHRQLAQTVQTYSGHRELPQTVGTDSCRRQLAKTFKTYSGPRQLAHTFGTDGWHRQMAQTAPQALTYQGGARRYRFQHFQALQHSGLDRAC